MNEQTILGNDLTVALAGQGGHFELNTMLPVMAANLLDSVSILATACRTFADRCVKGLAADEARCEEMVERSLAMVTALAPVIGYDVAAALAKEAEICCTALDLFVSIYGAEAGNMALRFKSVRGLYVGGGIAPKILDKLKDGTFMRSFIDKGRYTELLAAMPVQVVLNPQAGLRGAGYYAAVVSDD